MSALTVVVFVPNQVFFRNTSVPTQEKDRTLVLPVDSPLRQRATCISTASPMPIALKKVWRLVVMSPVLVDQRAVALERILKSKQKEKVLSLKTRLANTKNRPLERPWASKRKVAKSWGA